MSIYPRSQDRGERRGRPGQWAVVNGEDGWYVIAADNNGTMVLASPDRWSSRDDAIEANSDWLGAENLID